MKRILFVMQSLYNGGAEKSLINLLNEIPDNKYVVDLLLFKREGMFLKQVPKYVNVLETPDALNRLYGPVSKAGKYILPKALGTVFARINERSRHSQAAYRWQRYYCKKIKRLQTYYDVAIAYTGDEVMHYVADKVEANKKLVWIHNDYRSSNYSPKYDCSYFENMDAIVSVSEKCVEILKEEFPQFADKCFYIENITSSSVIRQKADEYQPEEYQECKHKIVSIGRLHSQKGFDLAIEAASIMKQKGFTFKWFVIGDGKLENLLKQQIKDENVEDCFVLLGTRDNPYPYIKECTIFVQPSRFEGKSVVLDEAKILAAPILATAYPTVRDQIIDGKEGMIVEMNAAAIAEGITTLLQNSEMRQELHNYLSNHEYGNEKEIDKYINLIG